jgi:hypothetical protein
MSVILAAFLLATALITLVVLWTTLTPRPPLMFALGVLLTAPFAAMFMGFMYYWAGASVKDLFLWVRDPNTVSWRAAAASLLVLLAGSSLFYFGLRLRSIYGATEVLIGVGIAMQRVLGTPKGAVALTTDVFLALLTASVYLVVRGFDNIHQGLIKGPFDPLATAIMKWLRGRSATLAPADSGVVTAPQHAVPEPGVKPGDTVI